MHEGNPLLINIIPYGQCTIACFLQIGIKLCKCEEYKSRKKIYRYNT